jgi:Galactose oxidase, central domain/Kelch motif
MKTPNDNLVYPRAWMLFALALNSAFIQPAAAQPAITIFTNNFNLLSGPTVGYSYGDVANPSHTYVNGAGVSGSVGAEISGDFVAPGLGYGGIAFQYQNTSVTKNTDTNLSDYILTFDAKANRDNGGFQIILQTWSGVGFGGTGPLTSSSLADVILGPANVFVHCSINLGTQLSAGASATAKSWQIAFVMDEAYFGGPGVGNQLVIDNVAVTMGGPLWKLTGSLNTPRDDINTTTLLPDGTVLIAGGFDFGALASAELYNPTNGTWALTGSLQYARDYQTTTLLANGKVLAAGGLGFNFPAPVSVAELYDPATKTWTGTNLMNTPRFGHTATLLASGKVLVAGGINNGVFLSSAELYDPANNQWSYTGTMTTNRVFHTATLLNNGKVLVVGGQNNDALNNAELYDPTNGTWTATGPLNYPREYHTATLLLNGKVLVAGGSAIAELYDPATGTWSMTGPMNSPRTHHIAILLPNGKVLVAGGQFAQDSAELYDPATGTWSVTASLNTGREDFTATLLNSGKVLIAAGADLNDYPLASAELYNPAIVTGTAIQPINAINLSNGVFQFAFTNTPGASFNVFGTTNLSQPFSNWIGAGSVTEISSGHYQFNDAGTTNYPNYFYRVRSP